MTTQPKPTVLSKSSAWVYAHTLVLTELLEQFRRLTGAEAANNTTAVLALLDTASRTAALLTQGTEEAYGDQGR